MAAPRPWHEAARGPANDIVPWRKVARRQRRQAAVPPARSTPPRRARVPLAPRCCWPRLRALRTSGGRQPPPEGPRAGVPARRRGAPCLHGYGSFGAQCRHTAINMHATVDLVTRGSTTGHFSPDISYRTVWRVLKKCLASPEVERCTWTWTCRGTCPHTHIVMRKPRGLSGAT